MAHARKGGISHSPGQQFAAPSNDTHHRSGGSHSAGRRSRFQVQQLATSGAVVRIRRNSNLQLPKQRLATSLRKRPFVRQGDVVAYRRRFCEAGRGLAPRSVLPVCAPGRWSAVCWQLLHPPSKIENRRLLIKKTAKRYEHSAGLRVEPSERQPQARDRHKRQSAWGPNTFGCAKDPAESNRAESTQANSNSAAENAARGPRCSVFFPGWQKTRLWGLSKHLEVAEKARKGAAKRQKRQKSPQWGPECHTGPMQRGPLSAFSAILRAKPRNRRFPQRKTC